MYTSYTKHILNRIFSETKYNKISFNENVISSYRYLMWRNIFRRKSDYIYSFKIKSEQKCFRYRS